MNCVGSNESVSPSGRLAYLKSYLSNYALRLISPLQNTDSNFKIALDMLDSEFLNIPRLVHSLLDTILNSPVLSNNDLEGARLFLNETRSLLKDLQGHGLDLLEEDSAGLTLISHIIFSKLPSPQIGRASCRERV